MVEWIRGDYAVSDPTLTRFFMLHVCLLPIVLISVIAFHFYALRFPHVNNLDGEEIDFELEAEKFMDGKTKEAKVIPFWPAFLSKDFLYVSIFMIFFFYLVGFHYGFAMDPINFDPANASKTPAHIYPEWYFLWQYEILRGFFFDVGPIKAADIGFVAFGIAGVALALVPFLDRSQVVAPAHKNSAFLIWFWILVFDLIALSVFGKLPANGYFMGIENNVVGFVFSILFFVLVFIMLPLITIAERKRG